MQAPVHLLRVVVAVSLSGVGAARAAPPADDPCRGALDAVAAGDTRCRSPLAVPSDVAADAVLAPQPVVVERDPAVIPAEVGFIGVVVAAAGVGAITVALLNPPAAGEDRVQQQAVLYGGVAGAALGGLLLAAAAGTAIFNPATGALQLPIFDGEPR